MTYKELLNSVTFEDVESHIVNMYSEAKDSLGWFKLHYDMRKLIIPKHHDDANVDVCHITMKDLDDGTVPHLSAFSMAGDLWEHSLTKEIVLDANVHATNAEIVACCLWHSSFYVFVKGHTKEWLCIDYKSTAKKLNSIILRNGGYVSSKRDLSPSKKQELIKKTKEYILHGDKPTNKTKRKRHFRHLLMNNYYERMVAISSFIIKVLPALSIEANCITIDQLCKLFYSGTFECNTIQSFADETTDATSYIVSLISKYDMLSHANNAIIYLATGHCLNELPIVNPEENDLLVAIGNKVIVSEKVNGTMNLIFDYNPVLGHQIEITVVATDISIS